MKNNHKPESRTVSFVSLGCFKNTVDSEVLGGMLKERGMEIVSEYENPDWLVINTCGFIRDAKEEKILEMDKTPAPKQEHNKSKTVAIIVAHPDDETLWAGGTILCHPTWQWFIVCLCRASDTERALRFYNALKILKSEGIMGDLDDSPEQKALDEKEVERAILNLLPQKHFDLIISHNPTGEYTRHVRHEEASKAVIKLWHAGKISTNELWTFAYEDGGKEFYPKPVENATICHILTKRIWLRKYSIIIETYGFEKSSWEAETTPLAESFWQFSNPNDAKKWLNNGGVLT